MQTENLVLIVSEISTKQNRENAGVCVCVGGDGWGGGGFPSKNGEGGPTKNTKINKRREGILFLTGE